MAIKFNENTKSYEVSFSKRHPVSRVPASAKRTMTDEGKLISTKAEAQRIYNQLVIQVENKLKLNVLDNTMTYNSLLAKFYESLIDRDLMNATIENYKISLGAHTQKRWGHKAIDQIKPDDIRTLIKVDLESHSKTTQKTILKYIRGVFNFAVDSGYLHKSPVPFLQFRASHKFKAVLNEANVRVFLEKAKAYDHEWYPHWATALYTGMRNEELYALRWYNVNLEERLIYVKESWTKQDGFKDLTKTCFDRVVEIAPPLIIMLKELKLKHTDSNFVLPRINDWDTGRQAEMLRIFLHGIGLPEVTFHNLRASWATITLSKGVDLVTVMKMGGWRSLKTLEQHYLRLSGFDIKGATDKLNFHNPEPIQTKVIDLPNCSAL